MAVHHSPSPLSSGLETLYHRYNRRRFVPPDPLQFLYRYEKIEDREVAGMVASGLAFGRVAQILKAVDHILTILGPAPRKALLEMPHRNLESALNGFRYRFVDGTEMTAFLAGLAKVLECHGSVEGLLFHHAGRPRSPVGERTSLLRALQGAVEEILDNAGLSSSYLLPDPGKGSACKRLFLFLRWMIRSDRVDPGGWSRFKPSALLVPLDTHMYNIARDLGLTVRKGQDMKTAIEITEGFARLRPDDPVRYDFVLTRFGIREELDRRSVASLVMEPDGGME